MHDDFKNVTSGVLKRVINGVIFSSTRVCTLQSPFIFLFLIRKRELIFVLFVRLFDLCLFGFVGFPLPLSVWEGLRFAIVALPGLLPFFFF